MAFQLCRATRKRPGATTMIHASRDEIFNEQIAAPSGGAAKTPLARYRYQPPMVPRLSR
jgi:hypothetical protein